MTNVWFTSDTHFDHKFLADLRGFESKEEHDEAIIERWNSVVRPKDTVWHLGDVGMGRLDRFARGIERLNGELHLIAGNHDECSSIHRDAYRHLPVWLQYFASIQSYARRRIAGRGVMLSHYPYKGHGDHTDVERFTRYRLVDDGLWLLHGHIHSPEKRNRRQIHVGLDAWDLTPVHLDQIAAIIDGTNDDIKPRE